MKPLHRRSDSVLRAGSNDLACSNAGFLFGKSLVQDSRALGVSAREREPCRCLCVARYLRRGVAVALGLDLRVARFLVRQRLSHLRRL